MIDLDPFASEPFLLRLVSAGHETESEAGLSFLHNRNSAFGLVTRRDLAQ